MKDIKDFFIKLGRVYGFGPSWGAYLNLKDEAPFLREKDPYYVVENRIKEICRFQAKHSGSGFGLKVMPMSCCMSWCLRSIQMLPS